MLPPRLLAQIRRVAQELPPVMLESVIKGLELWSDRPPPEDDAYILRTLPHTHWRQLVSELLEIWHKETIDLSGQAIATALATAAYCETESQKELSLEIVWTGPEGSGIPVRRTEQVLLQLIREARHDLTIVSFAVYKVPEISQALIAAINRGVVVKIIAETPESNSDLAPFGVKAGLGAEVAKRAEVFVWDRQSRPKDAEGRHGSLHMKCAIADQQHLFITSANLTGYALSLNMEMGLLVHSNDLASQVVKHLDQLIHQNVLARK